jgi:iron complex transport system permease protein
MLPRLFFNLFNLFRLKKKIIFLTIIIALILAAGLSLSVGAMRIPFSQVWAGIAQIIGLTDGTGVDEQYAAVLGLVRLPRVVLAILAGAALGISGAAVQGIFRNPLAEPALIGISAGASLVSAVIITLEMTWLAQLSQWMGHYLLIAGAFAGALLTAMLIFRLSKTDGKISVTTMLLAGIAINAIAGALTGLLSYLSDDQQLRSITFWMLGSLAGAGWEVVAAAAPFMLVAIFLLPLLGKKLNVFALGELQASQLGIRPASLQWQVVLLSALATGAAVAVCGIIGFVGLIVPHIIRLIGGVDNRYVLPASALSGALVLTVADMLARVLIAPVELPIGVITALLGAPVFLYILIKDKKKIIR